MLINSNQNTLVLGIGNYLLGDEGVGVHIARQMIGSPVQRWAEVVDGGTGGFHLMGVIDGFQRVIMIDATMDGQAPGTVRLTRPRFVGDFPPSLSAHDIGLKELVSGMVLLGCMPSIDLITISVEHISDLRVTLSPMVSEAVGEVQRLVSYLLTGQHVPHSELG